MTINLMLRLIQMSLIAVLGSCLISTSHAEETVEFSDAERLLWLTDQLKTVDTPIKLGYAFERTGTFEPGFKDTVHFIVEEVKKDGMKAASLEFFTGERRFDVPRADSTNVNPVLKIYLQGDVYEMNRLTDPKSESRERWRYFQRRIKFALADGAKIEDVEVSFAGAQHPAKRVTFVPYANDPKRSLFEEFADKSYAVTISDSIPGYLYRIETVIPGASAEAPPLIKEVLQLVSNEPIAATTVTP